MFLQTIILLPEHRTDLIDVLKPIVEGEPSHLEGLCVDPYFGSLLKERCLAFDVSWTGDEVVTPPAGVPGAPPTISKGSKDNFYHPMVR